MGGLVVEQEQHRMKREKLVLWRKALHSWGCPFLQNQMKPMSSERKYSVVVNY